MNIKRFALPALAVALAGFVAPAVHAGPAAPADQVAASFQRLLGHEASRTVPATPPDAGEDPLRAAISAVIWQSQPTSFHAAAQPRPKN